jgi:HSP20 family molecular chaperone IbpA
MSKDKKYFFAKLRRVMNVGGGKDDRDLEETITTDEEIITDEIEQEDDCELAIDMFQNSTEIVIQTMVAGVKPDDLDIAITRDMVTIKGRRTNSYDDDIENDFFHKELYWGTFSRTIILPSEIDIEEALAGEKHGLLTITLPKIDKNKHSKLKVKTN